MSKESGETTLSVAEVQALLLSQAAIALGDVIDNPERSLHALAAALDRNANVWVSLKAILSLEGCSLSSDVQANIGRLADYVLVRTNQGAENVGEETVRTFININLQIAEGLLEGIKAQ